MKDWCSFLAMLGRILPLLIICVSCLYLGGWAFGVKSIGLAKFVVGWLSFFGAGFFLMGVFYVFIDD